MIETPTVKLTRSSLFATPIRRMLISAILLGGLLWGMSQLARQATANQTALETLTGRQAINRLEQNRLEQNKIQSPESSLQEAILLANDGAMDDFFGISVAINGDTAVVGSEIGREKV